MSPLNRLQVELSGLKSWDGGPESYRSAASREVFPCSWVLLGIPQTAIIDNWDYVKLKLPIKRAFN